MTGSPVSLTVRPPPPRAWRVARLSALGVGNVLLFAFAFVAAQEPPDLSTDNLPCVRAAMKDAGFTQDEIDELFGGTIAKPASYVQLRIGPKQTAGIGSRCFPETDGSPAEKLGSPEEALPRPPIDLPPATLACLKEKVGEQAVRQVSQGLREPTPEENEKGKACFSSAERVPGGAPPISADQQTCAIRVIGPDRFAALVSGVRDRKDPQDLLTPAEMRRLGNTCFGGGPGGGPGPDRTVDIPPGTLACLVDKFGKDTVEDFRRGERQPSAGEIASMQDCFKTGGPPVGEPSVVISQCVTQCAVYQRPEGGRFSTAECQRMCAGGPPPGPTGPPNPEPEPTGPPPGDRYQQCLSGCKAYEGGQYNVGDLCERACRREPVQSPTASPTPEYSPYPSPVPTPYPTAPWWPTDSPYYPYPTMPPGPSESPWASPGYSYESPSPYPSPESAFPFPTYAP